MDAEPTRHQFTADAAAQGRRIDAWLAEQLDFSRNRVKRLIEAGAVSLDGRAVNRPSVKAKVGNVAVVDVPAPTPLDLSPADIPLEVLYEDRHLIVVNKQPGLVVHPGPGHPDDTLVNALLGHVKDLSGIGGAMRPGIVHRLDKDTSGVLVVAKTDVAHQGLAEQFEKHTVERAYQALVRHERGPGLDEDGGTFETLHGRHPQDRKRYTTRVPEGRRAVTHYQVLARYPNQGYKVECRLETGRTHQIRVHFGEHGCPIIGDRVYGSKALRSTGLIARQALHAWVLGFIHPASGEWLRFEGLVPEDFRDADDKLKRGWRWR